MIINGQEIPGDWETMSCYWGCGFIMAWERGVDYDFGLPMNDHLKECPMRPRRFGVWPFKRGGSDGNDLWPE